MVPACSNGERKKRPPQQEPIAHGLITANFQDIIRSLVRSVAKSRSADITNKTLEIWVFAQNAAKVPKKNIIKTAEQNQVKQETFENMLLVPR
jgi:hypothetical protein